MVAGEIASKRSTTNSNNNETTNERSMRENTITSTNSVANGR